MIDARLEAAFAAQEAEDAYRLAEGLEEAIGEEFEDAERIRERIDYWAGMSAHLGRRHAITEAEKVLAFSIQETLVRVSAEFSIRKHTTCQTPYFHGHDFYEMIYVWRGRCGQKIMGDKEELSLSEGDLCILTPGMVHAMLPCGAGDVILKIIIPCPLMRRMFQFMEESEGGAQRESSMDFGKRDEDSFFEFLRKNDGIYTFRGAPDVKLQREHLMDSLIHETYWGGECKGAVIRSLLALLLIGLKRDGMEQAADGILQKVFAYVRSHMKDASLEELARLTGYSSRQLRRKIAEASGGGTFSDILWKVRMEEAATLLNGTDISVEEVARTVGYDSVAGFYKRFLAMFRMTPAAYRKMYR